MKKPADLRAHIEAWMPDLKANPDKLHMFIEDGRTVARMGKTLSFEYRYTLLIIVTDYAESTDALLVPILAWLSIHQPNLLLDERLRENNIGFRAEPLDNSRIDIELKLELSERVIVRATDGGGYECEHIGEPTMPDLTGPTGWEMFAGGQNVTGTA